MDEARRVLERLERIERLRAAGWLVIRVSAADLRNLDAVVEKVRAALASR